MLAEVLVHALITQREAPSQKHGIQAFLDSVSECLRSCMWRLQRTLVTLAVLEKLHALESSGTADELVGEFGLVVGVLVSSILLVDLIVGIFGFS